MFVNNQKRSNYRRTFLLISAKTRISIALVIIFFLWLMTIWALR